MCSHCMSAPNYTLNLILSPKYDQFGVEIWVAERSVGQYQYFIWKLVLVLLFKYTITYYIYICSSVFT